MTQKIICHVCNNEMTYEPVICPMSAGERNFEVYASYRYAVAGDLDVCKHCIIDAVKRTDNRI